MTKYYSEIISNSARTLYLQFFLCPEFCTSQFSGQEFKKGVNVVCRFVGHCRNHLRTIHVAFLIAQSLKHSNTIKLRGLELRLSASSYRLIRSILISDQIYPPL